jgi:hypothetical protein
MRAIASTPYLVATVLWLAGPGASAVTGQVIEVGGGLVCREPQFLPHNPCPFGGKPKFVGR